jgi:hypothetical protein
MSDAVPIAVARNPLAVVPVLPLYGTHRDIAYDEQYQHAAYGQEVQTMEEGGGAPNT